MAGRNKRYQIMERYMTCGLLADCGLFGLYLLCAGFGIVWLKVVFSVVIVGISGLCLAYLFLSRELLRPRSLWMTVWAGAVLLCLVVSLALNYPGL